MTTKISSPDDPPLLPQLAAVDGISACSNHRLNTPQRRIPSRLELDCLGRELVFRPPPSRSPSALSPDDVAAYRRDGFRRCRPVFEPEELAHHRLQLDHLTADRLARGSNCLYIPQAHLISAAVYDLLLDPRLVAVARDLLGENVIGWDAYYFLKLPMDHRTVAWHRDAEHWPLTPSNTVTIWLPMQATDVDNACLRFVPGTHRRTSSTADLVHLELRDGEFSVHSDLVVHGSGSNSSCRPRANLTLRYCTPDVRAYFGWHAGSVLVSGEDPTGNWSNEPRPTPTKMRMKGELHGPI